MNIQFDFKGSNDSCYNNCYNSCYNSCYDIDYYRCYKKCYSIFHKKFNNHFFLICLIIFSIFYLCDILYNNLNRISFAYLCIYYTLTLIGLIVIFFGSLCAGFSFGCFDGCFDDCFDDCFYICSNDNHHW